MCWTISRNILKFAYGWINQVSYWNQEEIMRYDENYRADVDTQNKGYQISCRHEGRLQILHFIFIF